MEDGNQVPERLAKAGDRLRRQRDLGHQHDRVPPPGQRLPDEFDVDERLAGTGYPVQEEGPAALLQRASHAPQHCALGRGRREHGARRPRTRPGRDPARRPPWSRGRRPCPRGPRTTLRLKPLSSRAARGCCPPDPWSRSYASRCRLARPKTRSSSSRVPMDRVSRTTSRVFGAGCLAEGLPIRAGNMVLSTTPSGRHVVLRDPAGQRQQFGPHRRLGVEDGQNVPHPRHLRSGPPTPSRRACCS